MITQMLATFILPLGAIIFVDLTMSGDNVLVIGAAIVGIPQHLRKFALAFGGAAAILLRIVFSAFATSLLHINYLQTIGGLLLLWVTNRLLAGSEQTEQSATSTIHHLQEKTEGTVLAPVLHLFNQFGLFIANVRQPGQEHFFMAILAILITDVSTSLDNILAIAALAQGQIIVLGIGLVLSIIILLIGSSLVALLLERFPNLIILSGFVLGWLAGDLITQDASNLFPFISQHMLYFSIPIHMLTLLFVVLAIRKRRRRARRRPSILPEDVDLSKPQSNGQSDSVANCNSLQEQIRPAH